MSNTIDMTVGSPIRLMVRFSIPLMLTGILQLAYSLVDSAVVGRLLGVNAFASVGVASGIHWLFFSAAISMSHGYGMVFAQRFGAKDLVGLRLMFINAVILTGILGTVISSVGFIWAEPMLALLNTPGELMGDAVLFLRFMLGGMFITFFYNLISAILYALGDGKTPLRAMIVSTVLNIVLDVALVKPFGIAGVAVATLLAQMVACVYCIRALRSLEFLKITGQGVVFSMASIKTLLRFGLPLGFRDAVIQVGGLVIQFVINGYGAEFVAGIAAAKRMYSLLLISGGAFEAAAATYVAQNYGAGEPGRIKRGVSAGRTLMLVSSAVIAVVTLMFRRGILALLLDGGAERVSAVLDIGARQLSVMALGIPVLYLLFLYRSALQGMGNTFIPMLSGFFELIPRVVVVLFLTPVMGEWGVYLSDAAGWVAATLLLIVSYVIVFGKLNREMPDKQGGRSV